MTVAKIPVELIFTPSWWFQHYGITFDEAFYLDQDKRIASDLAMRGALYHRFGLGSPDPEPRPIIGSMHVAGGFVMPALFGLEIRFQDDQAPWPVTVELDREGIMALEAPDIETTWPMDQLLADMEALEGEWGYVVGDFDTDGLLNTALHIRGEGLYVDFYQDPELVHHLLGILAETYVRVAQVLRSRTGSCAIATNRSIIHVDRALYLHSNCSVQMISPSTYQTFLLPYERYLAERLQPYGIHHCGDNLHRFTEAYAPVGASFYDVGWGSDVALCRQAFPEAYLNLRLSPVRLLQETPAVVRQDLMDLVGAAGGADKIGVCCINMDPATPDENVNAIFEAVEAL